MAGKWGQENDKDFIFLPSFSCQIHRSRLINRSGAGGTKQRARCLLTSNHLQRVAIFEAFCVRKKCFMTRLLLLFVASTVSVAQLHADDLPTHIRRTSAEILGTIEPSAVDECVVRRFADPYPSLSASQNRREYRWRVRVPDGSKVNIIWAHGALPEVGVPDNGRRMIPSKSALPSSPGDIVIVVRATNDVRKQFEISVFPEFPVNSPSIQSTSVVDADWLPYWKNDKPTLNHPDERTEKRLEPKGQQLLMKHFVNEGGVDTGFVVWLDFGG